MALENDFRPDEAGLLAAVQRLVTALDRRGVAHRDPEQVASTVPARWERAGLGGSAALGVLSEVALEQVSRLDHPGFFAHMDPPTPWPTWAAAMWAAAVNQNLLHPDTAPAARTLEQQVISWLAPEFGMGGGHLVPGSTVANLTALWAARDLCGARRVITSAAAHVSVAKAAHLLGLDLVEVPVDDAQQLRVDLLPDDLSRTVLVLTAGTVATGAIDPLDAGKGAAWRHVDAAWAGPLRLTRHAGLLDGIDDADSVSVSAHKWLYQPKESALVLFADPERAHAALSFGGSYLAAPNVGLLGSHGNSALPLAVTLLAWGRDGVAARIEADLTTADRLAHLVAEHPELQLWRRPRTGVVNWRPTTGDARTLRDRLTDAWVSVTDIDGQGWLRSVASNPFADPEHVVRQVVAAA
jgi:L-2,4-diaminobutyrate decarboxylase